jgi:NADPH2:quinone reductase
MRCVEARQPGGAEVLAVAERPDPSAGPGELVVELAAAGVNFIDTYRRAGVYPMEFPHVPGVEGAGRVLSVGEGVRDVEPGAVVAWASTHGSYAEKVVVPAAMAVPVPDGVDPVTAAAVLLQGMTAQYLVQSTFPVREGHDVVVHAAAGGVGLLLTQLAASRGARVIGTVSTEAKEAAARAAGAAAVLRYDTMTDITEELPAAVRGLTGGKGVHAVFDGVGAATFAGSMASLRTRGMLVLFGASSGVVPPVDPQALSTAGSIYLTRPNLAHYTESRGELLALAKDVFDQVLDGSLGVHVGATFPFAAAADAHSALESRSTTGKVVLVR